MSWCSWSLLQPANCSRQVPSARLRRGNARFTARCCCLAGLLLLSFRCCQVLKEWNKAQTGRLEYEGFRRCLRSYWPDDCMQSLHANSHQCTCLTSHRVCGCVLCVCSQRSSSGFWISRSHSTRGVVCLLACLSLRSNTSSWRRIGITTRITGRPGRSQR